MNEPTFICTRCHGEAPMSELSELPPFFFAAARGVDARCVHTAVSEDVRETNDVLELLIVRPRKQVAEIVWEHLLCQHFCQRSQLFEHLPDVRAIKRPARPRDEYAPADDAAAFAVGGELAAQRIGQQDRPELALVLDMRLACAQAFDRDGAQLAHPYAEGAERLHQQGKAFVAVVLCRPHHAFVLGLRQLFVGGQKGFALNADVFEPPV